MALFFIANPAKSRKDDGSSDEGVFMKHSSLLMRNFFVFTVLLFLCLASLGFYSLRAGKEIKAADSWVAHTQKIIIETQAIVTSIHQMLAAQRGYLLTGDLDFKDRYEAAKEKAKIQIDLVEDLSLDNTEQKLRIERLEENFEEYTDVLETSLLSFSVAPNTEAIKNKRVITELRDQIVAHSDSVLEMEYTLLNSRAAALEKKSRDYRNTLWIGGLGCALLLLLLNGFLLRAQSGRTLAERTLKATEERLALAVRGSNNGVFDWDLQTGDMYWSPQFKSMLGYDDKEIHADPDIFAAMLHPDDKDRVLNTRQQYINENLSEYSDIFRMQHKSGRWVWVQAKGMGLFGENGRAERFVGTHTDITHLKDYERRLEEEKDRAEKANAAKSEFLAHMSHEIRTPLTAISGIAEILSGIQDGLNDKQKKLIQTLSSSATSLKDLIADILDFSRIESSEIELNERQFDLASLFEQVLNITSVRAAEKQLVYTFDYDALREESFYGDQGRIRQILINLIGNAIKFTDKGYVNVTAQRQVIDKIAVLVIEVKDTGIGINPDAAGIIFEKFRQADASVSRKYGGTGLGLPISRKLAELMNGTIKFSSEAGKGSTFILYLPFKERDSFYGVNSDKEDAQVSTHKEQDRLKNILAEQKKILMVEDYEGNIVVLSHLLEEMGFVYDIARTGVEALRAWKESFYDLILMDVQMPEMDGLTATRTIREIEHKEGLTPTPIVGLTAHAMVADREKCIASGMNTYLPKPIDEAELQKTIQSYIKKQPGKDSQAA